MYIRIPYTTPTRPKKAGRFIDVDTERHPAVVHLMGQFTYDHLPPGLQDISRECCELASSMYHTIADNPELTTGLRKLLEAKDCFVRAYVSSQRSA